MSATRAGLGAVVVVFSLLTGCGTQQAPVAELDLSGTWRVQTLPPEEMEFTMVLEHAGDTVMGTLEAFGETIRIQEGRFANRKLLFKYAIEGEGEVEWALEIEDDGSLSGTATSWEAGTEGTRINLRATRITP